MALCTRTDEHPCSYGCELRRKGVGIAPSATPNRTSNRKQPLRAVRESSWEKGIVYDERPGGYRMPVLEPGTRSPLHVKQYGENRQAIDEGLKRLKSDPGVVVT
jgi:hypothetical protein